MKYCFADCILDEKTHSLTKGGVLQSVEPQVFDLILYLVQNAGILISKDQLIDAIWAGRIVSDSAISARISVARGVLGDDGKRQTIIRTVPRRGFQFMATVTRPEAHKPRSETLQSTGQTIRFATADDGTKLAYATSGTGPPFFYIAHFPSHLELAWNEKTERVLFDQIGESQTLVRMDYRGSGLSDLDVTDLSLPRCAEDMKAIVDALGLGRVPIFGTSSGAMIAIEFAVKYPEHVSQLIVLGGYAEGRSARAGGNDPDRKDTIYEMAKEGWDTPKSAFISGYLSIYMPTATNEQILSLAEMLQNSCPEKSALLARQASNNHSVLPLLDKVKAPTLVLHCEGDTVHPLAQGRKLARGIPDAQLLPLDSRNHYPLPQEESWQVMMEAIKAFVAD